MKNENKRQQRKSNVIKNVHHRKRTKRISSPQLKPARGHFSIRVFRHNSKNHQERASESSKNNHIQPSSAKRFLLFPVPRMSSSTHPRVIECWFFRLQLESTRHRNCNISHPLEEETQNRMKHTYFPLRKQHTCGEKEFYTSE